MKKLFKLLFKAGIVAGTVIFAVKQAKSVKYARKLERELPAFLSAKYGEKPVLKVVKTIFNILVNVEFSQDVLNRHEAIESEIRNHARIICPGCDKYLLIKVVPKEMEEVEG